MQISVVIPVYIGEVSIYELVQKVIDIKWWSRISDFEMNMLNDESKDRTLELMEKFAAENNFKIKICLNEKFSGNSQMESNGTLKSRRALVVVQEYGDFEYKLQEINELVVKILDEELAVLYTKCLFPKNKVIYWQNCFWDWFVVFVSHIFTFLGLEFTYLTKFAVTSFLEVPFER